MRTDVRNGVCYEESEPFDIVTLTRNKFVCRDPSHDYATYTLQRIRTRKTFFKKSVTKNERSVYKLRLIASLPN